MRESKKAKKLICGMISENPILEICCKKMGINRSTIYRWMIKDPGFKKTFHKSQKTGYEKTGDIAESKLLQLIEQGNFGAIKYFLSNRHSNYNQNLSNISYIKKVEIHEALKAKIVAQKIKNEISDNLINKIEVIFKDYSNPSHKKSKEN